MACLHHVLHGGPQKIGQTLVGRAEHSKVGFLVIFVMTLGVAKVNLVATSRLCLDKQKVFAVFVKMIFAGFVGVHQSVPSP